MNNNQWPDPVSDVMATIKVNIEKPAFVTQEYQTLFTEDELAWLDNNNFKVSRSGYRGCMVEPNKFIGPYGMEICAAGPDSRWFSMMACDLHCSEKLTITIYLKELSDAELARAKQRSRVLAQSILSKL